MPKRLSAAKPAEIPVAELQTGRNQWMKREPVTELGHRIVSATVEEFARKGVLGARVAEITRLAGTTDPAFYRYFIGLRQAAFFILNEYYWKPLNLRVEHYKHVTDDPRKLLETVVQALIQSREDDPTTPWLSEALVFQIVVGEGRNPFLLPESLLLPEYETFSGQLEAILQAGQQSGIFTSTLRPSLLAQLLIHNLHGLLVQIPQAKWSLEVDETEMQAVVRQLVGIQD